MLSLKRKGDRYYYSLLGNPLPRVMKFEQFHDYFSRLDGGGVVIDYGSGDRPYEEMLLTKFDRYLSVDYAPTNLKHGKRPDIYIEGSSLDVESGSIDCAVMTEVLEHLYEPKVVLAEIARVLKPGGALIGTVPFVVPEHEQPYDFYRYTYFCLEKMFEDSGFEIVEVQYVGDMVGSLIAVGSRVLGLLPKALAKIHLGWLGSIFSFFFKIPEFVYHLLFRMGLDFRKIGYFKGLPMGFTFYLRKASS